MLNISKALKNENTKLNHFESIVTLIIQEQHFLDLLSRIKRSFIFSGQIFDLEILEYKQILHIGKHLFEIYSHKEIMLDYQDLLDFRFARGTIAFTQDSIIYTLKIPILNPMEFSLIQRLAIINNNNQTEITYLGL